MVTPANTATPQVTAASHRCTPGRKPKSTSTQIRPAITAAPDTQFRRQPRQTGTAMRFTGGGAGIHIYGSVLVQGGIDDQTVSGQADVFYSSMALDRMTGLGDYQTYSWREM